MTLHGHGHAACASLDEVKHANNVVHLHNGIFTIMDMENPQTLLGTGSYGKVYSGTQQLLLTAREVAIKVHEDPCLLNREVQIYRHLWYCIKRGYAPRLRIPRLLWEGPLDERPEMRAIVLDKLGSDMETLFQRHGCEWSAQTVCWVASESIQLLRDLHNMGIVHRDIKPANFAIGEGTGGDARHHQLHLFDFGLSTQYIDTNRNHLPEKHGLALIGNRCFGSIWNHKGVRQSRRDDLASLCYMIEYFLEGSLPWGEVPKPDHGDARQQGEEWTLEQKCAFSEQRAPNERRDERREKKGPGTLLRTLIDEFHGYVGALKYDEKPKYDEWAQRFLALGVSHTEVAKGSGGDDTTKVARPTVVAPLEW
jgi:serine/threonine protein kinase